MIEIRILSEKEAKEARLVRAQGLAQLFETRNGRILGGLESLLARIEYESLLMIKNNDDGRHVARGKCDLAATLLSRIKEEIDWATKELEKTKPKKEKS